MSVILKRSNGVIGDECPYRCCSSLYGRHVKPMRRKVKRSERQQWKRDLAKDW